MKRLFKSLCAQIDGGHFVNALKTCEKVLRINSKDSDALQAKLFLLLQTEQYDAALALISENGSEGTGREFEKAYALYRLRRESDAGDVLSNVKGGHGPSDFHSRGIIHLEAQLAYRQSTFQSAFDLYSQLLDTSSSQSEEHDDLLTNMNAAQTHLDFLTSGYLRSLDALPASVINTLETAPPPAPPGSTAISNAAAVHIQSLPTELPKQKKTRMSRVPKGVVPGVTPPPDPERWLKKSERTTFNQGSNRRRKAGGGATQGSVAESSAPHGAKQSAGTAKQKKKK